MTEGDDNSYGGKIMTALLVDAHVSGGGRDNTLVAVWMLYFKFAIDVGALLFETSSITFGVI
jgi:hypothetical protein